MNRWAMVSCVLCVLAVSAPASANNVLTVTRASLAKPVRLKTTAVVATPSSQIFGNNTYQVNCHSDISATPIAVIQVAEAGLPLHLVVSGGQHDGFLVRNVAAGRWWSQCNGDTIGPQEIPWLPGRYEVYPTGYRTDQAASFEVIVFDPAAPAVPRAGAETVTISGPLATPRLVTVKTQPKRRALRDQLAGYDCHDVALPDADDVTLVLERPVPGLIIRPLPTVTPVVLRLTPAGPRAKGNCVGAHQRQPGEEVRRTEPTYAAPSEVRFAADADGTFGLSVGTRDPAAEVSVTLLIFDRSTKLDPLAVVPFGGDAPTLAERVISLQMPELAIGELHALDHDHQALVAAVFAAAPRASLVYARIDFDPAVAESAATVFPVKDEPLLLVSLENERALVLTLDGLGYVTKAKYLVTAPSGSPAIPASPRPLPATWTDEIGEVIGMLPPEKKKLGAKYEARVAKRRACRDQAWAPYGRQLPSVMPGFVIAAKSPEYVRIENAGLAAQDKQCGSSASFEKETEGARKQLLVVVTAERAKLLAQATSHLR